ncbi:maltase 1-like [Contarinia nasturtii]|uniref:maltase 1-like n=1 Tax=Contarinia nasturtii TaxID=265458 RepID=UPI0012D460F5|nr:maltase 1-like [Contarinia nasturtii]XP_031638871.1 maltase 1-like [Contarinia nasturtii]XP_031638872.1 maltase 1-like [Contarinia nasturtii]
MMQTFVCVALLCVAASAYPSDDSVKNKADSDRPKLDWWENGVFYQIYPRSFKDSDGDGIGDIRGIIQGLDYLQELGIDCAWLSPIFKSPMVDFGYDIEDFYAIDPMFGTIEDLEELFVEAKKRNIKIILDFVPNHTSDKCEWFKKSVKREPGYENFYIWADGKNNNKDPPNNWLSMFYGTAWTFNEERNQWFYHAFAKEQPELNFRNEAVVERMIDVLKFWLDKGADGFRIDAPNFLYEDKDLRDEPLSNFTTDPNNLFYLTHENTQSLDEVYDMLHKFRKTLKTFESKNKDQLILMTEAYVNATEYVKYFGSDKRMGVHIPFNFVLIEDMHRKSTPEDIKNIIDKRIASVPAGTRLNWVMGNHDRPRISSRYGEQRIDGSLTLVMTLPGIACTYYGEEIGMVDNRTISYNETLDPQACNFKPNATNWMDQSRDPQRTPFQWDGTKKFAGFMPENATSKPWLPINQNYKELNVEIQRKIPRSTLNFYKQLIQIRKRDTFAYGSYTSQVFNENVFAYVRELDNDDTYWVLINFRNNEERIDLTTSSLGKNMPEEFELALVGTNSHYVEGANVNANEIVLRRYDVIILKEASS